MIVIDSASPVPPFEQLRAQLARQIQDHTLAVGTRLPTIRRLAADLGLAVNTVGRAYRELEEAGLIETRGPAGSFVSAAGEQGRERARRAAAEYAAVDRQRRHRHRRGHPHRPGGADQAAQPHRGMTSACPTASLSASSCWPATPPRGRVGVDTNLGTMLRAAALADIYLNGHLTDERGRAAIARSRRLRPPRSVDCRRFGAALLVPWFDMCSDRGAKCGAPGGAGEG